MYMRDGLGAEQVQNIQHNHQAAKQLQWGKGIKYWWSLEAESVPSWPFFHEALFDLPLLEVSSEIFWCPIWLITASPISYGGVYSPYLPGSLGAGLVLSVQLQWQEYKGCSTNICRMHKWDLIPDFPWKQVPPVDT